MTIRVVQNNRSEWVYTYGNGTGASVTSVPYPNREAAVAAARVEHPGEAVTYDGVTQGVSRVHTPLPRVEAPSTAPDVGVSVH